MVEEKKSLAPVHQRKKIAAILSLIFYFVLLSGVGMLFWSHGIRSGTGIISPFYGDLQPEFILSLAQVLHSLFTFLFGRIWLHLV